MRSPFSFDPLPMHPKILEIENLTVSFDGFKALNQLNFSMERGELRVVIGPNGAGKTTFLDVITGKVQPTVGRVIFQGRTLASAAGLGKKSLAEHQIARLGIGRKFQTPRIYLNLTPRENLELSCNRQKGVWSSLWRRETAAEKQAIAGLLETVGLVPKANLPASLLSHGEKQRLEIGMLVAQSPDLLLVDEPVAGLTDEETERIGDLLLSLAEQHSILVIEHDMEFVRQIARTVTVLHEGSVLCEGTIDQIQNDPRVIEVYLGQQASITPRQMKVLRILVAMAWSDGELSAVEMDVMLSRLSQQFAEGDRDRQEQLQQELRDYFLTQQVNPEALIAEFQTPDERSQLLQLSYEVIQASARMPGEARINQAEAAAFTKLAQLLDPTAELGDAFQVQVGGET